MTRSRLPLLLAAGVLAPLVALGGPAAHAAPTSTEPTSPPTPTATTSGADPTATPEDAENPTVPVDPDGDQPPLEVRLEAIRPAVVPRSGPLRVAGTVTNRTESTWTGVQTFLAVSPEPLTTPEELAAAQAQPPGREPSFGRLVEPGLFADLPDLGPGESAGFRLVVPRDRLGIPETSGVYRLGVHALGTEDGERLDGADGRARTFLAQLPRRLPASVTPTRLALVMQLRNHVVRAPTGELEFIRGWRETLSPGGRLGRLLGLSGTTGGFPLSWVLDPAVVEAAGTVARGNPSIDLGGRGYDGAEDLAEGSTSGAPAAGSAGPSPTADATSDPPSPQPSPSPLAPAAQGAADASDWLESLRTQAPRHPVLAVPYGDLDVAAAARAEDATTIDRAVRRGLETLTHYEVTARPVVAPLNGALKGWMIDRVPRSVPVVLSDDVLPTLDGVLYRRGDRPVLLFDPRTLRPASDAAAAAGVDRTAATALGMRQRLLAVTAVRTLAGDDRPLVAMLPPSWDPGPDWQRSDFFDGLDVPWIAATGLGDVAAQVGPDTPSPANEDYRYRRVQRRAEIPTRLVRHVRDASHDGALLDETLVDDDATGPRLGRQALLAASFYSRRRAVAADLRLSGIEALVDGWLRRIRIAAPDFVISSSEQGSFLVPVSNGLDQRVRVALRAEVTGLGLEVTDPGVAELPPGARRPFKMGIRSTGIGVHTVDLDLVTRSGERLYAGPQVPVRTSRVGLVVWVVMGVAATVFFAAIAVRVVRRVRRRRRTFGPVLRGRS